MRESPGAKKSLTLRSEPIKIGHDNPRVTQTDDMFAAHAESCLGLRSGGDLQAGYASRASPSSLAAGRRRAWADARALRDAFTSLAGCGAVPVRRPIEDQTRRVAPLPACVMYLPARRTAPAGTLRHLKEEEISKLVFPTFDQEKRLLPKDAPACTGRAVLGDPLLAGGTPTRGAWPLLEEDGDALYGSGGDRIKVVWLRFLKWNDGTVGGPLSILRPTEKFAELFAVGSFRGHSERVKLGTQRMGSELLVIAEEDNCEGRKDGDPCENRMTVFLPRRGILQRIVDLPIERVAYVGQGERGASGTLQYHLTTAADYKDDGIHLVEQIRVSDENGRDLRKAELERVFAVDDIKGTMTASEPPLWDRVVVKAEAPPPEAKPAPDAHPPPRHH